MIYNKLKLTDTKNEILLLLLLLASATPIAPAYAASTTGLPCTTTPSYLHSVYSTLTTTPQV